MNPSPSLEPEATTLTNQGVGQQVGAVQHQQQLSQHVNIGMMWLVGDTTLRGVPGILAKHILRLGNDQNVRQWERL